MYVVIDAMFILNASCIEDGAQFQALLHLHDKGYCLFADQSTWDEVVKKLSELRIELRLTYDPVGLLAQLQRRVPIVIVPSAPKHVNDNLSKSIRSHDAHIAAAAHHYKSTLLTDDHELILSSRGTSISCLTTAHILSTFRRGQRMWLRPRFPLKNRSRPRAGHALVWWQVDGWASTRSPTRHTVFDWPNRGCVFFDNQREVWSAGVDGARTIAIPWSAFPGMRGVVCLSYKISSSNDDTDTLTFRVASFGGTGEVRTENIHSSAFKQLAPGPLSIGCSRHGNDQLNGSIRKLSYGPHHITSKVWRTIINMPEMLPSLSSVDTLRTALKLIVRHGHGAFYLPAQSDLS